VYIDDKAFGCPKKNGFVDWDLIVSVLTSEEFTRGS
jgi:hypothetical protein